MTAAWIAGHRAAALRALADAGVWDPGADTAALVAKHLYGVECFDEQRVQAFRADVAERCARIPLGHILGYADFGFLRLMVGSGTFVPRCQSLAMLRWIERNLRLDSKSRVYDLCAGVGALGLSIWSASGARVTCVESDPTAQAYLQRNIVRLGAERHLSLMAADITQAGPFEHDRGLIDMVVANPPYVAPHTDLLPEWSCHHPPGAIYARDEGGELIEASARLASTVLKPAGALLIEHGEAQVEQVETLMRRHGFQSISHCVDDDFSDATGPSVFTVGRRA